MEFATKLITYRGIYKTINTAKLNVPCIDGRRTILSNHMPIILPLDNGVIETDEDGKLKHYAVSEGILYFEDNKATVVCDVIEDIETVDVAYYEKRLEDAKKQLNEARADIDIKKATIKLTRATNVIDAAKRRH